MNINEKLQIIYDYKLFIRESILYNYTKEHLEKFAKYMDDIFYPQNRKYNIILNDIISEDYSLLFSENLKQYIDNNLINDSHLEIITMYINTNLKPPKKEYQKRLNIALLDFKTAYERGKLINIYDINSFANYMQGFYPKFPFFDVAKLLMLTVNKDDQSIINEYFLKFFYGECINLKHLKCGHFMEIINFSETDNSIHSPKKVYIKEQ